MCASGRGTRPGGRAGAPAQHGGDAARQRLVDLLRRDKEPDVLARALFALGHLGNHDHEAEILAFKAHPADRFRHGVAFALCGATTPDAVAALLRDKGGSFANLGGVIAAVQDKERSSVLSTTNRHSTFADSPAITRVTSSSSFDPRWSRGP